MYRVPVLWGHSVCAVDQPYGDIEDQSFGDTVCVCSGHHSFGYTVYVHGTSLMVTQMISPMGTQCIHRAQVRVYIQMTSPMVHDSV